MNILLTGANGFIGSALHKQILGRGYDCLTISTRKFLEPVDKWDAVSYEKLNSFPFDTVYHLGGLCENNDSSEHFEANVVTTNNLLRYISTLNRMPRFIFTSTINVYGINEDYKYSIDSLPNPKTMYATSKLLAENLVNQYSKYINISSLNIRLCPIIGPGVKQGIFHDLLNQVLSDSPTILVKSLPRFVTRPFIELCDVVDILLNYIDEQFGTVNLAPDSIDIESVILQMQTTFGTNKKVIYQPQGTGNYFDFDKTNIVDGRLVSWLPTSMTAVRYACEKIKGVESV